MIKKLLDILANAVAIVGYKVMDGDNHSVIIRDCNADRDFEITIKEVLP